MKKDKIIELLKLMELLKREDKVRNMNFHIKEIDFAKIFDLNKFKVEEILGSGSKAAQMAKLLITLKGKEEDYYRKGNERVDRQIRNQKDYFDFVKKHEDKIGMSDLIVINNILDFDITELKKSIGSSVNRAVEVIEVIHNTKDSRVKGRCASLTRLSTVMFNEESVNIFKNISQANSLEYVDYCKDILQLNEEYNRFGFFDFKSLELIAKTKESYQARCGFLVIETSILNNQEVNKETLEQAVNVRSEEEGLNFYQKFCANMETANIRITASYNDITKTIEDISKSKEEEISGETHIKRLTKLVF